MNKIVLILLGVLIGVLLYLWQTPEMSDKLQDQIKDIATPDTTTVYKWQDENGTWQISNSPPPGNIPYETMEYHEDTNVMPSDKPKAAKH